MSQTLNCWQEIALFLHTGVRTAQRWEREYGLPIHRAGNGQALVFAFPAELQNWLRVSGSSTGHLSGLHTATIPNKGALEYHRELRARLCHLRHVQRQHMAKLQGQRLRFKSYLAARQTKVDEALARKGRILVEAQERKQMRVACDLDDDINQRLALYAMMLNEVQQHTGLPSEVRDRLCELEKQIQDLSSDVHAVAHELHPSNLEYLGIVAALSSLCKGFAQRRGIEIEFTEQDVPNFLSPDISHCLFRVLQEALSNAARHGGAKHIEVQLRGSTQEVHLVVVDQGVGFDIRTASKGQGLGLTSMRERVRLMNGTLVIRSKLMAGTTVHACVPIGSEPELEISPSTTRSWVM